MKPIKIEKQKLLLVEGNDEVSVFNQLFINLGRDDIQIIDCGGNIQLKDKFPALIKAPGFSDVTSYAILQDADTNAASTLQRVQHLLRKYNHPVPVNAGDFAQKNNLRVGIYILPGNGASGMLEDLYLKTIDNTLVLECIDECIDNLKVKCPSSNVNGVFGISTNLSKARTLGTFMATAEPHNRLGLATKSGYWNLEHIEMNPLRDFINLL